MKKNNTFRRAAALMAALSITVSLAAPAFADTYYIDYGDITITKNEDGSQTIQQGGDKWTDKAGEETVITTSNTVITTLESDLEGPAAEDSDFGPVVEDNYQPAQPEDAEKPEGADQPESAEEPEGADQPESAEEPKSADRQESADQQAAPAAAPADTTPVNPKDDGFWGNTITVINNIADKVLNLTLKDVKIDVSDTGDQYDWDQKGKAALSVQGDGNVEIELDGDNELKSGTQSAGLEKNSTGTLTLKDDNKEAGSLTATGGFNSAGIGGGYLGDGKNITITGGTVTATGGSSGAGIGGGREGKGENITITGGTVTATGNEDGAGIGGGSSGSGENITITGGTVNATGDGGAGIGGGNGGDGKNITITGGTVEATGYFGSTGIGGGNGSDGKNITITGGSVTATGGEFAAGIGGSNGGSGNNITIKGGTVTATGGEGGAGIGGGAEGGGGNNITIKGGTVTATGGGYRGNSGAGIGGGSSGSGENITINDGKVTATGGNYAAGIGGGSVGAWGGDAGSGKNITINGGTVNATGTDGGAGIGGGGAAASDIELWGSNGGNGEDITINGGKVNASGAYGGAGIGGGVNGIGSKVTVSGAAQVTATATGSGPDWSGVGTGATIGNGGSKTPDGPVDGKEIQADISHLTTGYIHHIIYNPDLDSDGKPDGILKEWWEFALPKPIPDGESLDLHVETLKGAPLPFNTRQQGRTLRVTTDNLSARLHGTRQALETLQEQGVEQIQFVTTLKTTTLSVADLLAEGGSWFALEHNGLGSRQLSAAQAESLKCRMR